MKAFTTTKLACYLLAVFTTGGATGAMLATKLTKDRMYRAPNRSELTSRLRGKLVSRLNLTVEQVNRIDPAISETAARLQEVHRDCLKRTGQIMRDFNARIASELTPAQQTELEKLEKERQDFIRRKCRPQSNGNRDAAVDRSANTDVGKKEEWFDRPKPERPRDKENVRDQP